MLRYILFSIVILIAFSSCKNEAYDVGDQFHFEVNDYFTADELGYNSVNSDWNAAGFYEMRADSIASLGRILFYDKRLSKNNTISCESCHQQNRAFADARQFSIGLQNGLTSRSSMTLVNSVYQNRFFWESESIAGLFNTNYGHQIPVLNPISNHIEMGMANVDELILKLEEIELYQNLFEEVYDGNINEENISQSLQLFIKSIISSASKYDQVLKGSYQYNSNEALGLELFQGKALCGTCHRGDSFVSTWRRTANIGLDMEYEDDGAGNGHFKVPTLRNIELTGPYMHDGRFETLEEVVDHYMNGVKDHPELDWILENNKINLTLTEQEALIAFLHTLTDNKLLTDPRFSNPF